MIDNKRVGKKIQSIRKSKGYSQDDLASLLDIGERQKISRIENGKQSMTANELIKFCDFFHISLDVLLTDQKLASEEFIEYGNRYLTNRDISVEEKREVIKSLYIQLANQEFNMVDNMYKNMDNKMANNKKCPKTVIEKYEIGAKINNR